MSERELFEAALDCASVDRARFLDEACGGDPCLADGLRRFLPDTARRRVFWNNRPCWRMSPVEYRPIAEAPGSIIGRYKLLERIGEGGFGVVYMAEQERPVRRKVALEDHQTGHGYCPGDSPVRVRAAGPGHDGPSPYCDGAGCWGD